MDKILVTRSSMPPFDEYTEEIRSIWETRWLTNMGEKHQKLEENLREYLDCSNVSLCVNGHLALECILEVFSVSGEVITTPFTFVSTTNAILRRGLKPVFCDINDRDFTIDVNKIESLITEKTSAIMPVHVYGNVCDCEAIQKIADKYGLKVIYDAAHAFGVKVNGTGVANLGDASMFSFHATKVFHTIEGGAAVFKDEENYEKFSKCKNFGIIGPDELGYSGGNAKMNEFSAAMGLCNLRHIGEAIASRKEAVERYRERLLNVNGIQLSETNKDVKSNYAYFPVVIHPEKFGFNRDEVMDRLGENDVGTRKYFYPLTSTLKGINANPLDTPVAKKISDNILCLPLFEGLSRDDVDRICDIIIKMQKER